MLVSLYDGYSVIGQTKEVCRWRRSFTDHCPASYIFFNSHSSTQRTTRFRICAIGLSLV